MFDSLTIARRLTEAGMTRDLAMQPQTPSARRPSTATT